MASILLHNAGLSSLKAALVSSFKNYKSSHLTEALAASLGFRTHAALLSQLEQESANSSYYLIDEIKFTARLESFGYVSQQPFNFELLQLPDMISTVCDHAHEITYKSKRALAWRNVMICTINEGIKQGLISLRVNPESGNKYTPHPSHLFDFTLPCGLPARGYIGDADFYELSIHVAVNPNDNWVKASNAGFLAGDIFATGWVERERGAWLQTNVESLKCRKHLLDVIANMKVNPLGYGDRGRIIL